MVVCEDEVLADEVAEGGAPGDVFVEGAGVDEEGDGGGGEGFGGAGGAEEGGGRHGDGGEGGDAVALRVSAGFVSGGLSS